MKRDRADSILTLRVPLAVKLAIKRAAMRARVSITRYMLLATAEKMDGESKQ